jgi:hypothetical protein
MGKDKKKPEAVMICEKCLGKGIFKERTKKETYSIHYVETVDVYVCEKCGHSWWIGIERELS